MAVKCILLNQEQKVSSGTTLILQDTVTLEKYNVLINNGRIELVTVSDNIDATEYSMIDVSTGVTYNLIAENGRLMLEEV